MRGEKKTWEHKKEKTTIMRERMFCSEALPTFKTCLSGKNLVGKHRESCALFLLYRFAPEPAAHFVMMSRRVACFLLYPFFLSLSVP